MRNKSKKRFNNALFTMAVKELFKTQVESAEKLKISGTSIHYMMNNVYSVSIVVAQQLELLSDGKYKAIDLCTAERAPRGKQKRVYSPVTPEFISRCNDGEITIRCRYMTQ